jgi:DNA-binding transcriptional regulator YhcF (GntR family)
MKINILHNMMNGYQSIVDVILEKKNEEGVSAVSQKFIANKLNCSQTLISQKLKILEQYGFIQKIKPGQYKVIQTDIKKGSQFSLAVKLLGLISEHIELVPDYKKQSELLNVDLRKIQRAWGIINQAFGSPYK